MIAEAPARETPQTRIEEVEIERPRLTKDRVVANLQLLLATRRAARNARESA